MIRFNQIINSDIIDGKTPSTKRFDYNEIEINNPSKNYFRYWNPFKSTLSAAILCGLEIIPINKNSSLLYVGDISNESSLNLLDLVENKQKIFCFNKSKLHNSDYANLQYIQNLQQLDGKKFSIIYINDSNYPIENSLDLSNKLMNESSYLIILLSKSSLEKFNQIFMKLLENFELLQELNIEFYFKEKSLLILRRKLS